MKNDSQHTFTCNFSLAEDLKYHADEIKHCKEMFKDWLEDAESSLKEAAIATEASRRAIKEADIFFSRMRMHTDEYERIKWEVLHVAL